MKEEIIKAVLYPREQIEVDGKKYNKYIMAAIVVTDQDISEFPPSEGVLMGRVTNLYGDETLTDLLGQLDKYEATFKLGDIHSALLCLGDLHPDNCLTVFEKTEK